MPMKPLKDLIERFGNDFTAVYINNVPTFPAEKTGQAILTVPFPDPEIRLPPVVERPGRGDHVPYRRVGKATDAPVGLYYLCLFDRQLVWIGKLLVIAPSAPGKI